MHPRIPSAARPRLSKVRACAHPALMGPMSDSIAALPRGDDIEPVDGSIPAPRMAFPGSDEACCGPWSLRCTRPLPGLLRAMAIFCGA